MNNVPPEIIFDRQFFDAVQRTFWIKQQTPFVIILWYDSEILQKELAEGQKQLYKYEGLIVF